MTLIYYIGIGRKGSGILGSYAFGSKRTLKQFDDYLLQICNDRIQANVNDDSDEKQVSETKDIALVGNENIKGQIFAHLQTKLTVYSNNIVLVYVLVLSFPKQNNFISINDLESVLSARIGSALQTAQPQSLSLEMQDIVPFLLHFQSSSLPPSCSNENNKESDTNQKADVNPDANADAIYGEQQMNNRSSRVNCLSISWQFFIICLIIGSIVAVCIIFFI